MTTHGSPSGDRTRQGHGVRGGEGLLTQTVPALQTRSPRPNACPVAGAEDEQREVPLLPRGAGLSAKPSSKKTHRKAISWRAWLRWKGEGTGGTGAKLRFSVWRNLSRACRDGETWQPWADSGAVHGGLIPGCCSAWALSPCSPASAACLPRDKTLCGNDAYIVTRSTSTSSVQTK